MRYFLLVLLICLANSISAQSKISDTTYSFDPFLAESNAIGKELPAFSTTADGLEWNNVTLKGKTVFINLWFEACPPCIVEIDALNELYEKLKNNNNILFLSITYDGPEQVNGSREKYGIRYPVISLSRELCHRLNQQLGFPTNMVLSSKGKIVHIHSGGAMDKTHSRDFVMNTLYHEIINESRNNSAQ